MADAIDDLVWMAVKTGVLRNYSTLFNCPKGATFSASRLSCGKVRHRCRECGYWFEQDIEEYQKFAITRQLLLVQCGTLSFRKKGPTVISDG